MAFTPRNLTRPAAFQHRWELIDFTDDGYPGFLAEAWATAPLSKTRQIVETRDEGQMRELLLELYPNWNFVDEDGADIPHEPEGFEKMPQNLIVQLVRRYRDLITEVKNPN